MATDIYELVQQTMASKRQSNISPDKTPELIMQGLSWMSSQRDKESVRENAAISNYATLIPLTNTDEGIANLASQLQGLSVSSENQPTYDVLSDIIDNRGAQWKTALPYVEEMYNSYNVSDPKGDKYTWDVEDILEQKITENNAEFLFKEVDSISTIIGQLENAKQQGFNYKKKIGDMSIDQLLAKAKRYSGMLGEAIKAAPGGIKREEAVAMVFNDYGTVQDKKLTEFSNTEKSHNIEMKQLRNFINQTNRMAAKSDVDDKNPFFRQYVEENLLATNIDIDLDTAVKEKRYGEIVLSARKRIDDIVNDNKDLQKNKIFWGYTGTPSGVTTSKGTDVPTGLFSSADLQGTSVPLSSDVDLNDDGILDNEELQAYNDLLLAQPGISFNAANHITDLLKNNPELTTSQLNEEINKSRPKEILDPKDLEIYNTNIADIDEVDRKIQEIEKAHEANQSIRPIGDIRLFEGTDTDGDGEISQEELFTQGAFTYDEYKAMSEDLKTSNDEMLGITENIMVNLAEGKKAISDVSEAELFSLMDIVSNAWKLPEEVAGDMGATTRNIVTSLIGLKGLTNADKAAAILQYTGKGIVDGSKNIMTSFNISNSQVQEFLKDKDMDKLLKKIDAAQANVDKYKGRKPGKVKWTHPITGQVKVNKPSEIAKYYKEEVRRLQRGQGQKWAKKWFGNNATQKQIDDVARLFSAKEGPLYNIFNMRNTIGKDLPKLFGTGLKGFGNMYLGTQMFDYAFHTSDVEYLKDHPWQKLGIELVGTATAGRILQKNVWNRLTKMVASKSGRAWLTQKLGKTVGTKVITGVGSGGGVLSLLTGTVGAVWGASDLYNVINEWDEDLSSPTEITDKNEEPMSIANRELLKKLVEENPNKDLSFFVSELNKAAPSITPTTTKPEPVFSSKNYDSDPFVFKTPGGGEIERTTSSNSTMKEYTDGKNKGQIFNKTTGKGYTPLVSSVSPVTMEWHQQAGRLDAIGDTQLSAVLGHRYSKLPDSDGETYNFLEGNPYETQTFGTFAEDKKSGSYKEKYTILPTPRYKTNVTVPFGELNMERHYDMYTNMDYNGGYNLNNESSKGIQAGVLEGKNREAFQKKFNLNPKTMSILDDIKKIKNEIKMMPATNFQEADKKYQKIKRLVKVKRMLQKEMFNHENNLIIQKEGGLKDITIINPLVMSMSAPDGHASKQYLSEDKAGSRKGVTTKHLRNLDEFPSFLEMQFPTRPDKSYF